MFSRFQFLGTFPSHSTAFRRGNEANDYLLWEMMPPTPRLPLSDYKPDEEKRLWAAFDAATKDRIALDRELQSPTRSLLLEDYRKLASAAGAARVEYEIARLALTTFLRAKRSSSQHTEGSDDLS